MNLKTTLALASLGMGMVSTSALAAEDTTPPGHEALEEFRNGAPKPDPVQNRYFTKKNRFDITLFGAVTPTNPYARRFQLGLRAGYHFSEQVSLQFRAGFSPDNNVADLKPLTLTLLQLAEQQDIDDFQQPLRKSLFTADFGVAWAPFYGKINLIGEAVANFDIYLAANAAVVVEKDYWAEKSAESVNGAFAATLLEGQSVARPGGSAAVGMNIFITQLIALNLDARVYLYPTSPLQQQNTPPDEAGPNLALGYLFNAGAGVSFYFPKMKPRLRDF